MMDGEMGERGEFIPGLLFRNDDFGATVGGEQI